MNIQRRFRSSVQIFSSIVVLLGGVLGLPGLAQAADPKCPTNKSGTPDAAMEAVWRQSAMSERGRVLAMAIELGAVISDDIIQASLRDQDLEIGRAAARYFWLKPDAINFVLGQPDQQMIIMMLVTACANLESTQIEALLVRQLKQDTGKNAPDPVLRALMRTNAYELSSTQAKLMAASSDPIIKQILAVRYHIGDSQLLAIRALRFHGADGILALKNLETISPEIVDTVLNESTMEVRRYLVKYGKFQLTAAQQDRILNDKEKEVVIAFLSRKDILLTDKQIQQGAQTDDYDLGFWYWGRPEYKPTPRQLEDGLTAQNILIRRSFSFRRDGILSAMQIERGLTDQDEVVRQAFLGNPTIRLDDEQLNRCTIAKETRDRFKCVERNDYVLTQDRFNRVLVDWNANVLPMSIKSSVNRAPVELAPLVNSALASNSKELNKALLRHSKDLHLTAEQIERAKRD